jgi:FixJ family two-component response regulator
MSGTRAFSSPDPREGLVQHVLVIGGEPAISTLVQSALQQDGRYRVTRVTSSEEALPLLGRDRPSLAIIDSALPDMPGLELAERARREDVPVLLLTDRPEPQPDDRGFATLGKPVTPDVLIERSQALIEEARDHHHLLRHSIRRLRASYEVFSDTLRQFRGTIAQIGGERGAARRGSRAPYDFRSDPILRDALAYWHEKRGSRAMPTRRDIDPAELPKHLLPHLQLVDVIDGGERFYFRLVGTAIVDAFGGEFTGKHVDEMMRAEHIGYLHQRYRKLIAARRPLFIRSRYFTTKAIDMTANRLLMPLSQDGTQVNMILAALTFEFMSAGPGERCEPRDETTTYIDVG